MSAKKGGGGCGGEYRQYTLNVIQMFLLSYSMKGGCMKRHSAGPK